MISEEEKLLDLSGIYTLKQLKSAYYKKAIEYHPDKNPKGEEHFKKIKSAYDKLKKKKGGGSVNKETIAYIDILKEWIYSKNPEWDRVFIDTTIESIFKNIEKLSEKIFDKISKEKAVNIYRFVVLLPISKDIKEKMREIVEKKIDNIIILNPSINDLLEDKLYKMIINEEDVYIPLWHNEIYLKDIIIQCIPELEEGVVIDMDNRIYIDKKMAINDLLQKGFFEINLGSKKISISASSLKIKQNQLYILKQQGILYPNPNNIYDDSQRQDIIINILLH